MLHHYNYTSPLSHFLGQYPGGLGDGDGSQTPEEPSGENGKYPVAGTSGSSAAQGKSFTIAAILGLKDQEQNTAQDLTVVNLSVHQGMIDRLQGRLTLPNVRHIQGSNPVYRGSAAVSRTALKKPPPHTSSKSKRVRTIFTPEQLERLEAEFERQQYMVGPERLYLAHTLQLTEAQVKVWFQNRRIKWRKHHLEVTQQRLAAIKQRQMLAVAAGEVTEVADGEDTGSETDT